MRNFTLIPRSYWYIPVKRVDQVLLVILKPKTTKTIKKKYQTNKQTKTKNHIRRSIYISAAAQRFPVRMGKLNDVQNIPRNRRLL